jgi:integrase
LQGLRRSPETYDLRRTFRTGLARLGVAPSVAEALLGHSPGRLARTYDRYVPVAEMRAACAAWGSEVERLARA